MKTNEELQRNVQDAIKWERLLNAAEIGVTVKDGIVTLTGVVDSYLKKLEAEVASRNVAGVRAVIEKIEVQFCNSNGKSDDELATDILNAFKQSQDVPNDVVKVKVEACWVTLEGEVQWNYEKIAAQVVISKILGIKGISNYINIKADTTNQVEKLEIENALKRNWSLANKEILLSVIENVVTITGTVDSLYEKEEAGHIAWNAKGVINVENNLIVEDLIRQ